MKDHVKIGHLTRYDASTVNRHQVMDLEIRFKIQTKVPDFEKTSPKTIYKLLKFFISFVTTVKSCHAPSI